MAGGGNSAADQLVRTLLDRLDEDVSGKESIIQRCLTLCDRLNLSHTQLANEYESFKINSDSEDTSLSLEALDKLSAEVLKRRERQQTPAAPSTPQHSSRSSNQGSSHKRPAVMSASPRAEVLKVPRQAGPSPSSLQSPLAGGDSKVYGERKNAGERIVSYQTDLGLRGPWVSSSGPGGLRCTIGVDSQVGMDKRYRFMYTPIVEKAASLEKHILSLQEEMVEANVQALAELTPAGVPCQEAVTVVGRICCEVGEGRINRTSVMLEGSRRESGGRRIHVDLRTLPHFALFPGQIVACHGINASGSRIVAQELLSGVPRPMPTSSASQLMELQYSEAAAGGKPLSILVASGPFTTTADLEYAPLNDLLAVIVKMRPDVAILIGPFVDDEHPQVATGMAGAQDEYDTFTPLDFESLFKLRVSDKLEKVMENNIDLPTQFVLVPSLRDAFHDHVYPQPPFGDRIAQGVKFGVGDFADDKVYELKLPRTDGALKQVYCVGNPSIIKVNEVSIGITSHDILMDLSGEEVSSGGGDRLMRLTDHMLQQQSFYPLYPPSGNSKSQLDLRHMGKWRMPYTPDILITPSKLKHFARELRSCLCVNPGQLSRGAGGGSFAEMNIHPIPKEELQSTPGDTAIPHKVAARTSVAVVKI